MELWYLNGQSVVKRLEDINLNLIFPFSDSLVRKKILLYKILKNLLYKILKILGIFCRKGQ